MAKQIPLPLLYSIPANWRWIAIEIVASIKSGFPFDSQKFSLQQEGRMPLIRIRDVVRGETETFTDELCPNEYIVFPGDILIGMDGDFNIAKWKGAKAYLNQRVCTIHSVSDHLLDDYLFYYLPEPLKKINDATPSVTVKHLSTRTIGATSIPIPPISEQHRIVDRIESLFAKLDEAKEKAQAVVDGYEDRKAAILHKAFTGELTEEWRKKENISFESWQPTSAKKLFSYITSGSRGWAQYYSDSGAVFIRMGNLDHGTIELDLSDIQRVNLPNKAEGQRSQIKNGDILISITADIGMVGLVRNISFEGYINQHIALARPFSEENSEFIAWYLVSDVGLSQLKQKQRGATKVGLGLNDIRSLVLNMPILKEQKEIVKQINSLISKQRAAKEAAEQVIAQIDSMKKAILARAFRGELGTNDPSEEPVDIGAL